MVKALVVTPEQTIVDYEEDFVLERITEELKVEYIQLLSLKEGIHVYVDEEGAFNGARKNILATAVVLSLGFPRESLFDGFIHGSSLFFGGVDEDGEDMPLTYEKETILLEHLAAARLLWT